MEYFLYSANYAHRQPSKGCLSLSTVGTTPFYNSHWVIVSETIDTVHPHYIYISIEGIAVVRRGSGLSSEDCLGGYGACRVRIQSSEKKFPLEFKIRYFANDKLAKF